MTNSGPARSLLYAIGAVVAVAVVVAIVKRDTIAGLLLKGSDTTLTGDEAHDSPHAAIAVEFLGALRARDMDAIARLATDDQVGRVQQDSSQESAAEMLADLPADAGELRSLIKSVQTHEDRAVVLFETRANSWFVQLTSSGGTWKVSGF